MRIWQPTRSFALVILGTFCLLTLGCHGLKPESFAGAAPRFEPEKFFEGPTRSWGVIESRSGQPKSRFRTEMMRRRDGDVLVITQDFTDRRRDHGALPPRPGTGAVDQRRPGLMM